MIAEKVLFCFKNKMDVERCDKCHKIRESCECFCSICKISFYDRRNPSIGNLQLRLFRDKNRNYICTRCSKCHSCGINPTNYETYVNGVHFHRITENRWYCGKEKCRLESRNDVIYLERAARKKNALIFETSPSGRDIDAIEIHQNLKEMLPLNFFGIDQNEKLYVRKRFVSCLLKSLWKILGVSTKDFFHPEVEQRLTLDFANEISKLNSERLDIVERVAENNRKRAEKYPDEKRNFSDVKILEKISNCRNLFFVAKIRQKTFERTNRKNYRSIKKLKDISEKQFHLGISLWYLFQSIINGTSLDGMQPILIEMLKIWWNLGYYPSTSLDYVDVPNKKIKEIIKQYLSPILIRSELDSSADSDKEYNQDVTECVVCYNDFDTLIRFQPCGHRLVCENCCTKFSKCVVCFAPIKQKIRSDFKNAN